MKNLILLFLLWSSMAISAPTTVVMNDVRLFDLVRLVYGEIASKSYVVSPEIIDDKKTLSVALLELEKPQLIAELDRLLRDSGYRVAKRSGVVYIDREPLEPAETIVYKPHHRSVKYLTETVSAVIDRPQIIRPVEPVQSERSPLDVVPAKRESKTSAQDLDQLVLTVPVLQAKAIRKLLAELDTPTAQVLLKAAVYEVSTTQNEGTALQLAINVSGLNVAAGPSIPGANAVGLKLGGFQALISALDADSRFKSISRPQVRVKNGALASFAVGSDVPVLGATQTDKNGNAVQSIEYRSSGVLLTARPEIKATSIDLEVTNELSSFVATTTGVNASPTLIKRTVNTSLSLQDGEIVVLAGLQDDKTEHQETNFFGWLTGKQEQNQSSEVLIFLEAHRI